MRGGRLQYKNRYGLAHFGTGHSERQEHVMCSMVTIGNNTVSPTRMSLGEWILKVFITGKKRFVTLSFVTICNYDGC